MKKVSKMLALSLALTMTFGMTVSAATVSNPSPNTTVVKPADEDVQKTESVKNEVANAKPAEGSVTVPVELTPIMASDYAEVKAQLEALSIPEVKQQAEEKAVTQLAAVKTDKVSSDLKFGTGEAAVPVVLTVKPVAAEVVVQAPVAAKMIVETLVSLNNLELNAGQTAADVEVKASVDIVPPAGVTVSAANPATIAIPVNFTPDSSKTYLVLHQLPTGAWENIKATIKDGVIYGRFTSLSPIVVVEAPAKVKTATAPSDDSNVKDESTDSNTGSGSTSTTGTAVASPKTGETFPVAGMMTVICLAGTVICAKKVRYNK